MKTAIVIGATGLVGTKLVKRLSEETDIVKIIAITRRPISYPSKKVVNEVINFDKLEQHTEALTGDLFFSCLGTTLKQAGSIEQQRKVDLDYQFRAATIACINGVEHYLLVSSSGANAKSSNQYLKMKGELEEAILKLPFKRISILQPSLLIGERASFRLGETIGSWLLPWLCRLPFLKKYRPITGEQVANKMVALSLSTGKSKEVFRLDEIFD